MHVPPPIYAASGALAQHLLAPDRPRSTARTVAAGALAAASFALAGGAAREFRRRKTTVNPLDPSQATRLVTRGPNRVTRNPMYLGMAGLLTAHAVYRGGWLTPLPVVAFVVVIDRLQIAPEEAALLRIFGEDYEAYRDTVPRWVGPLHR